MSGKNAELVVPKYYDLERFRRSTNRKIWFVVLLLAVVAILSLGLALIAFARPIPVVVLDAAGKPALFEDTATPRQNLTDVRIEYFGEEFIRRFVGVDSTLVDEDLQVSLNMMTPAFRQVVAGNADELARRAKYKGQNVRSTFSDLKIRIGKYDTADVTGKVHLIATGKMKFEPRIGELEGEGEVSRYFLCQLALQRVPVTKLSIHGLQAEFITTKFFDTDQDLKTYMVERASRP